MLSSCGSGLLSLRDLPEPEIPITRGFLASRPDNETAPAKGAVSWVPTGGTVFFRCHVGKYGTRMLCRTGCQRSISWNLPYCTGQKRDILTSTDNLVCLPPKTAGPYQAARPSCSSFSP